MPVFQPNVPTGSVPFNQDYLNLQGNNQQLDISMGKDHYAFSDATSNNGYHKTIHLVDVSVTSGGNPNNLPPLNIPAPVALTGEIFSSESNIGLGADSTLWWQSAAGKLAQMTVNLNPLALANGYTFIPGGLILQWGVVAPTSGDITVLFVTSNIDFPKNCFNVQVTRQRAASSPGSSFSFWVDNASISITGFKVINNDAHSYGIFWYAIGN